MFININYYYFFIVKKMFININVYHGSLHNLELHLVVSHMRDFSTIINLDYKNT